MSNKDLVTVSGGIAVSGDVADFFKKNADVGSGNLSASLPQLKVTEANSQNEGQDGQYVAAGEFYYQPTKESFKTVKVSIMTISRGFWALDNKEKPEPKFTQLVGGMILETMQPFVMFVSGTRLQNMWDFGKEIKPFTKNKGNAVPMFAFEVELGLEKNKTQYGMNHVVTYKLTRNKDNQVLLINDLELLSAIRNGVDQLESTFESFIDQKEVDRYTGKLLRAETVDGESYGDVEEPTEEDLNNPDAEDVSDDVPF